MNENLEIDLILNRKVYSKIYNLTSVITIILLIFIYIIFTYKYQSYYISKGKMKNNKLELLVNIDDIKNIQNNNILLINNKPYAYKISSIDSELFLDDFYDNYQYIYLEINGLTNIDNYVYEIKIKKSNKTIAEYFKEYF